MAKQLVDDMTGKWKPDQFTDSFKDDIMALVKQKVKEGKVETVEQPEEDAETEGRTGAKIIDLTELLQRSLRNKGGGGAEKAKAPARKPTTGKTAAKPARKAAAKPTPRAASKTAEPRRRAA